MQPSWVIEDFERDNSFGPLAEEVKRQGYDCEVIRYEPLQSGSYDVFDTEGCVLFQGSINLALQLQHDKRWIPGAWLTPANYECMKYYAHLGKYLFNDHYVILPRGEVRRRKDWLYNECFGHAYEDLFFRPSSGLKPWTAGVFNRPNFDSMWFWAEEYSEPESPVVISTPKNILMEWRFVCAKGEVVSGCQYEKDHEFTPAPGYPEAAKELALEISTVYQPDPMFMVDICQASDDKYYLMEINSFSCGGLYACSLESVVEKASELAGTEWVEFNRVV